jgi:HlyD family secretion protein
MMNINKYISFSITLTLTVLAGCAQDEEIRTWNIANVTERNIIVAVQAAGIIEPVTTVELKSKASGEILEISAETGTTVDAGTLLVQIDKRTPRNSLAQADAELEAARARRDIAKSQRDRSEKLFKSVTLNKVDVEQSILEYANSKAEVVRSEVAVENARIALDDTEVRAPIQGTVIERNVEVGQVISSPTQDVGGGTELITMADLRYVQVRALVDETDIGKIIPGQQAIVTVAAYPNQPFNGTVQKVEPQAEDEEAVTLFAVIVTIENESGLLKPGMNAEVEIDIASRLQVPAIPTIALRIPADIEAAALFTGIDEEIIREQLTSGGMSLPDVASEASEDMEADTNGGGEENDTSYARNPEEPLSNQGYLFGGKYWIFVMRNGEPFAQYIQTGLTDLDYSEVISGIDSDEQIILLPSSDLILSQDRFKKWMGDVVGVPGMKSDKDKEDKDN